MANNNYVWPEFYMKFADKLLEYKDNRQAIVDKIYKVFDENGLNLIPLERIDGKAVKANDVDPFTVFGLFNRQISFENRKKIINGFKKEFSIDAPTSELFEGIPVLNNLKSIFYWYDGGSGEDAIDNIWDVFEAALKLCDGHEEYEEKFISAYDKLLGQKGIRWNLTMALFWIRPFYFINLDSVNREFLSDASILGEDIANIAKSLKEPPKAQMYLYLSRKCLDIINNNDFRYKNFPELSLYAYHYRNGSDENVKSNEGIGDSDVNSTDYWLFAPGEYANMWDEFYDEGIMAIGWDMGDLRQFNSKKEIIPALKKHYNDNVNHFHDAHCLWQFANEIKIGDIIFAKRGVNEIIGRGIVESHYEFDDSRKEYKDVIKVKWTDKGRWPYGDKSKKLAMKTLTKITDYKDMIDEINGLFGPIIEVDNKYRLYTEENFLNEVYISEEEYMVLRDLLKFKKNLILQGAPGVGKTFMAKRLAYSMMGEKDVDRVMMVQFHQSYSYEDFVMGYRPTKEGFELKHGSFYKFCKKAEEDNENDYFFIIDEINRGNLSKIFGELFMLIENDKRGPKNKIQLLYSDETFFIPENVHIIGLMNTADRSLAMIDYALRRRFAFFDLKPGFESEGFKDYQKSIGYDKFDRIITIIKDLNTQISSDESLGEGFRIGHSYFSNLNSEDIDESLNYVIDYEIIPLLKEYWFDEHEKIEDWSSRLREALR